MELYEITVSKVLSSRWLMAILTHSRLPVNMLHEIPIQDYHRNSCPRTMQFGGGLEHRLFLLL